MILGCIADDFTGASDVAGLIAAQGMATKLFTALDDISDDSEAGVLALKTRSISPSEAIAQSLMGTERFIAAGCRQIHFKYCSTFDSTPRGNIGPVAEALAMRLGAPNAVVCPAFPANGRTLYQGNLFVGDVPLSESGMRDHPLNPMTDSDIRRWLAQQTTLAVSHIALEDVRAGRTSNLLREREGLVVVDAIEDADLWRIGESLGDAPFVTGGSAIAMALPENFRRRGLINQTPVPTLTRAGPTVVLSGSCSRATIAQVESYRQRHPSIAIDVDRLLAGESILEEVNAFLADHVNAAPLAFSTAAPDESRRFVDKNGNNRAAQAIEALIAQLAVRAEMRGVRKFVVAGGETSGSVISALRPGALEVGVMITPGVPLLSNGQMVLALKSGNFGSRTFLSEAVAAMEPTT